MPSLIWHNSKTEPTPRFSLRRRITSIGASSRNDIVVKAPGVDDNHALIQYDGQEFLLQRLSQSGVSLVNNKKAKRTPLHDGDEITLGGALLTFILHDETQEMDAPTSVSSSRPTPPQVPSSRDYKALLDFSRSLLEETDTTSLLNRLMDAIIALTKAEKGFILMQNVRGVMDVRVARAMDESIIGDGEKLYSDSIVQSVLRTGKPLIISNALQDSTFQSSQSVVNFQLCSILCAPLVYHGELLGLFYVGNDSVENLFQQKDLDTVTIFASHAALIIRNAMLMEQLQADNKTLKEQIETVRFGSIIGASDSMNLIYRQIDKIAPTDVSVLVDGETGTGKELIAREIHVRSSRKQGPFISINCGAIPESLLESELFGHVKGAFTGASQMRMGHFQAADGGTLFLDEIGEMPLHLQVKILRALQERVITRVGGHKDEPIDIRILAATNRDLQEEVQQGRFREDLYYRLNVMPITLPPLRERGEDILLIAQYLLEKTIDEYDTPKRVFSEATKRAMLHYPWPGNIRELDNHIKKAVILASDRVLEPEDLGLHSTENVAITPLQKAREQWQQQYIKDVLLQCGGNRTEAAGKLGIDPRTIYRYLKEE